MLNNKYCTVNRKEESKLLKQIDKTEGQKKETERQKTQDDMKDLKTNNR